jgi:tRNA pseudouridine55 synthase
MQMPPAYSAVKFKGRPSYHFARKGLKVNLKPKVVNIYDIELITIEGDLMTIKVKCGSGTYIRSIAHEVGEVLGCGASVKELERTRIGEFDIKNCVSVKVVTEGKVTGDHLKSSPYIISLKRMLEKNPSLYIKDEYIKHILNGHKVKSGMLEQRKIKKEGMLKKDSLVSIKDSRGGLLAVHKVLAADSSEGINKKGVTLTGSVVVLGSRKIYDD